MAWSGCSLLDRFAGRQIFLIEISGWLSKGLALRALSKPVMFSGGFILIPVLDGRQQQVWQDHGHELRR
jgi:hypothetical protein